MPEFVSRKVTNYAVGPFAGNHYFCRPHPAPEAGCKSSYKQT